MFLQALHSDVEMGIVETPLIAAANLGIVELVVNTVDAKIPSTVIILLVCVFSKYYVFCSCVRGDEQSSCVLNKSMIMKVCFIK